MILSMSLREAAPAYFRDLQDSISNAFAVLDEHSYREDFWERDGGGGGRTRIFDGGRVFEKGGVNFSSVHGELPADFAAKIPAGTGARFFASGISLVMHPQSPLIPTMHANLRDLERGEAAWFGGGMDLTPFYPFREDVQHFHRTLKAACEAHSPDYYPRFKKWCDEYFTIRHRGEMRGVGGVFFDYLTDNIDGLFALVKSIGEAVVPAYAPLIERRIGLPYQERHRQFQLLRRGRYVEFNLVYDRGTIFGLETRGRAESVLMSLPPMASWPYDYTPEPGSEEARATEFFQPREWA